MPMLSPHDRRHLKLGRTPVLIAAVASLGLDMFSPSFGQAASNAKSSPAVALRRSVGTATGRSAHRQRPVPKATISLSGPLAVSVGVAYRYQVAVISNLTYARAKLWFYVPDCLQGRYINLTAGKPWHGVFTETYAATQLLGEPRIGATLVSPARRPPSYPPHAPYLPKDVGRISFPLTLAGPSAAPPPAPANPGCVQIGD